MKGRAHLFVYGTLMTSARGQLGARQRARLGKEACGLGPAWVRGELYDLGDYPGLVTGGGVTDFVHGEVFELTSPEATLKWIDDYEGISSPGSAGDEYVRRLLAAHLQSGGSGEVWAYVYQRAVIGRKSLSGGRWQGRPARNSKRK